MKTIREIQAGGQQPRIEILAHGLTTEEAALRVERDLTDPDDFDQTPAFADPW